jgi:outer membrane protein insertion porin family
LSEYDTVRVEIGAQQNDLKTTSGSSIQVYDFIKENGDKYDKDTPDDDVDGEKYNTVFTILGFTKDSRNRRIFADEGSLNSISLEVDAGDLYYYKLRYLHQTAFSLVDPLILNLKGRLGYGDGYGNTENLPIYENFTAGGVRSVRGYEFNSLGPEDSNGDASGANFQVIGSTEVLFPIPAVASSETFRVGVYFDIGNVFEGTNSYDTSELRQSVGVSAKWFSFIGPLEFSYAIPINDKPEDSVQNFQFALGATF